MNVARLSLSFIRSVLVRISSAVFIAGACVSAEASPPVNEVAAPLQSKYPKIQVRHTPLPANDKARQVAPKGTPRTQLPVIAAKSAKGGKIIRTDNTYLVKCPPPLARSITNATAVSPKAK